MVWIKPQELKDDLSCRGLGWGGKRDNLHKNLALIYLKLETPGSELEALGTGFGVHELHATKITASQKTHIPRHPAATP